MTTPSMTGFRWPPLRWPGVAIEGVANETLVIEGVAIEIPKSDHIRLLAKLYISKLKKGCIR